MSKEARLRTLLQLDISLTTEADLAMNTVPRLLNEVSDEVSDELSDEESDAGEED